MTDLALFLIVRGELVEESEKAGSVVPCFEAPLLVEHEASPDVLFEQILRTHHARRSPGPRSTWWAPADAARAQAGWATVSPAACCLVPEFQLCRRAPDLTFAHHYFDCGTFNAIAHLNPVDLDIARKVADGLETLLAEHQTSHATLG